MPEYEVIDFNCSKFKWIRLAGIFYVSKNYLKEFKIKFKKYKKRGC